MRKLLYITPYFAPQSQVGALRPLKFVRHLPQHGWQPIVLTDLWPSDGMDLALNDFVPKDLEIIRNYSHRAAPTWQALQDGTLAKKRPGNTVARQKPLHERILPQWLQNPELLPLGEHSPDMPWAYRASRQILQQHPDIEAILVNADPFAASVVGAMLAQRTGLPLIQDFRDIWAPCKLRRPRRPLPQRWIEDRLEHYCFQQAAHVVINTQISLDDYRTFYPDMPADKFSLIRNFYDADLVDHGRHPGFDRYTLLHLGNFSRFRVADPLVHAVARALELGVPRDQLQVVSTGPYGENALNLAEKLGVRELFKTEPPVPYHQTGALCHAADLLVYIAEPNADQRIASKFYDYLGARRPLLSISDNPESAQMLRGHAGTSQFAMQDTETMGQFIADQVRIGRQQVTERNVAGLTAQEAAGELAAILSSITVKK